MPIGKWMRRQWKKTLEESIEGKWTPGLEATFRRDKRLPIGSLDFGSLTDLSKASRKIFSRSAGTPGATTSGRPNSPAAKTTFAKLLPATVVLYLSMSS